MIKNKKHRNDRNPQISRMFSVFSSPGCDQYEREHLIQGYLVYGNVNSDMLSTFDENRAESFDERIVTAVLNAGGLHY